MLIATRAWLMVMWLMAMLRNTGVLSETGCCSSSHFAFHHVVAGHIDGLADVFHRPVVEPDVFDHAAPSAPALDAHAHLGAVDR